VKQHLHRWFVFLALGALLVALSAVASACGDGGGDGTPAANTPDPGRPPNIIFILTDDQRADEFQYMPKTLSLIGDAGMFLPNFFVSVPICCPSRASFLLGQYGHNHGILTNSAPRGGFPRWMELGHDDRTVATWLQAAGYRTGYFGKYLNQYPQGASQLFVPPGWDEWFVTANSYQSRTGYDYTINHNGEIRRFGRLVTDFFQDVISDAANAFVTAPSDQPFFAIISTQAPHFPFVAAPRHQRINLDLKELSPGYNEADVSDKPAHIQALPRLTPQEGLFVFSRRVSRARALQSVDDMVERLVKTLEQRGELGNTYIFVTSDNGLMFGEHRRQRQKSVPYEESIRVSLYARGPGIAPGSTSDALTFNQDIPVTFAEIAGVEPPGFVDGRSILPLLEGRGFARLAGLSQNWGRARTEGDDAASDEEEEDDEPAAARVPSWILYRTATYKYVEYETGERELYDLANDPHELDNLAVLRPEIDLAPFSAYLEALRTCAGASCRAAEDAPPPQLP
jgi:arylsulfatase A-like enzyme